MPKLLGVEYVVLILVFTSHFSAMQRGQKMMWFSGGDMTKSDPTGHGRFGKNIE